MKIHFILLVVLIISSVHTKPLDDDNQAQEGDDKRDTISKQPEKEGVTDQSAATPADSSTSITDTSPPTSDSSASTTENSANAADNSASATDSSASTASTEDKSMFSEEGETQKKDTNPTPDATPPTTTASPTTHTTEPKLGLSSTKPAPTAVKPTTVKPTTVKPTTVKPTTVKPAGTASATTAKPKVTSTNAPAEKKTVEKTDNNTMTMKGMTFHCAIRVKDEKYTDDLKFPISPVFQSEKKHIMTLIASVYEGDKDYKQVVVIKMTDSTDKDDGGKDDGDVEIIPDRRDEIGVAGVIVDFYLRFYTPGTHLKKLTEAISTGKLGTHNVSPLFVRAYVAEPKGRVCTPDCKIQCYSYCDAGCCHLHVVQNVELPTQSPVDALIEQQKQQLTGQVACEGAACQPAMPQSPCQGATCSPPMMQMPCQGASCAQPIAMPCQGSACSPAVPQMPCQGASCAPPQMPCSGPTCALPPMQPAPCQGMACSQPMPIPQMPCQGSSCQPQMSPCKGAMCNMPPIMAQPMPFVNYAPMPAPAALPYPCPASCSQVCAPMCPNQCCGMQPQMPPMMFAPPARCGPRGC